MRPAALLLVALAMPAAAAEPVLERVLLSTGGVGYLGFRAEAGDIRLRVPFRQVDDALKSLTLFGGGAARAIAVPGPAPLDDPFRGTPFAAGELASLPELLAALQGATVEVAGPVVGPRPLAGRVLAIAPETVGSGDEAPPLRHRLSLLTEGGIRSVLLEDLAALRLVDPGLRDSLGLALARLADQRLQPSRELEIALDGAARGTPVRLGYLAEMPVWKASYRLVAGEADGLVQGWAVLENMTGRDWQEVDVTLIAGSPTALRQALYRSYFVDRPEIPVLPAEPVPQMALEAAPRAAAEVLAAPPTLDRAEAVELTAQTLYEVQRPVTLAQGDTAMVPLIDQTVPVRRLARFRRADAGRTTHPEAALRLRNAAATSLPGGIATLFERVAGAGGLTFLGDAALPPLAPGEEVVLAHGRDGNIDVDLSEDGGRRLERARVVDGVLELSRVERLSTTYTATARFAGPSRELVVEQALPPGWRVAEPAGAAVEAGTIRLTVDLAGGSRRELTIVVERSEVERTALVDVDPERLLLDVTGDAPPALRAALDRLRALTTAVAEVERGIAARGNRRTELAAEQERLRANLEAVPPESDLARRYLDRLGASEDGIAALDRELEALRAQLATAAEERRRFLRALEL